MQCQTQSLSLLQTFPTSHLGALVGAALTWRAATGGPLSVGQSIGRYFGYYVSTIPLLLGLIWVAFDSRKQGWHDKLAGTVVPILD